MWTSIEARDLNHGHRAFKNKEEVLAKLNKSSKR
jgi:hypothetical protein